MAFPTSKDDLSTTRAASGTDKLESPDHLDHHEAEDAAIEAIEDKLGHGDNDNAPALNKLLRGKAANKSEWDLDLKDEDDMASDSATAIATQQSIKAYVDHDIVARVYLASNQDDFASGVMTLVELETETLDPNNDFNTTTHIYTAPVDGYYAVASMISWENEDLIAGKLFQGGVSKNDANPQGLHSKETSTEIAYNFSQSTGDIVYLDANDTLRLKVRQYSGVNQDIEGGSADTWMAVHLINKT